MYLPCVVLVFAYYVLSTMSESTAPTPGPFTQNFSDIPQDNDIFRITIKKEMFIPGFQYVVHMMRDNWAQSEITVKIAVDDVIQPRNVLPTPTYITELEIYLGVASATRRRNRTGEDRVRIGALNVNMRQTFTAYFAFQKDVMFVRTWTEGDIVPNKYLYNGPIDGIRMQCYNYTSGIYADLRKLENSKQLLQLQHEGMLPKIPQRTAKKP